MQVSLIPDHITHSTHPAVSLREAVMDNLNASRFEKGSMGNSTIHP